MSSILLSNPFAAPSPSAASTQEAPANASVAPVEATKTNTDTKDSTAFSGSGTGSSSSKQGDTVALLRSKPVKTFPRPAEATGNSVISAQATEDADPLVYANTLEDVEMPDPLPTSPFLKSE